MKTHDKISHLIDKIEASPAMDIAGRSKHIHDLRAAIEAERQRRGEPAACFKCGHVKHGGECVNVAPQPADPVVKESLTVPDGWQLVPKEPTTAMMFMGVAEWATHDDSEEEVQGIWDAMLKAAPTYSDTPKRLEDMSKAELIDLIESERDKHQLELDAIGAGGVSGKLMS